MTADETPVQCGVCHARRGRSRLFTMTDLRRHATLAHGELGYTPVKFLDQRRRTRTPPQVTTGRPRRQQRRRRRR